MELEGGRTQFGTTGGRRVVGGWAGARYGARRRGRRYR